MTCCLLNCVLYLQYKAVDIKTPGPGKLQLVYTPEGGQPEVGLLSRFADIVGPFFISRYRIVK